LIAGEETVEMAEVSEVGVPGPLGPFVAGFAAGLSRQGYKPQPVGKQLGLLAALSGWLACSRRSASRTTQSRSLARTGAPPSIWRGIRSAACPSSRLDGLLAALPLADWLRVTVTPLGSHPNDPATASR
jgi:muconolactone D-isomerase